MVEGYVIVPWTYSFGSLLSCRILIFNLSFTRGNEVEQFKQAIWERVWSGRLSLFGSLIGLIHIHKFIILEISLFLIQHLRSSDLAASNSI